MDGLSLLAEAYAAGLTVGAQGERLVVCGPRSAEPVARMLLEHKPEVMAALATAALLADPFAGWVRRQDVAGRWGWEEQSLPESQRWWARASFDDLPELLADRETEERQETAAQNLASCVETASVDTLDLDGKRPVQGHLRGFSWA